MSGKEITFNFFKSLKFNFKSFGKCGVAVIRVSGPGTTTALKKMAGFKSVPPTKRIELRKIRDPITKEILDRGLVFWFSGPKSFTGEDCCEFQIHGGPAVVASVLNGLGKLEKFRPAEPGEFTRRAFYSGKVDLTQVEGLAALIDSETEAQRRQALKQVDGDLFRIYNAWSQSLLKCLANVEAYIDFDEDQDLGSGVLEETNNDIAELRNNIKKHLTDGRRAERIREGVSMIILGAPNAGKSSLINLLCKRPLAIVSDIPGTTRDILEANLDIGGYPVCISDTAGIRKDTEDLLESEGIRRTKLRAATSDLIVFIVDAFLFHSWAMRKRKIITYQTFLEFFKEHAVELQISQDVKRCENLNALFPNEKGISDNNLIQGLIVINKLDLIKEKGVYLKEFWEESNNAICAVSCKTEEGIFQLLENLIELLKRLCGIPEKCDPVYCRVRQKKCLEECLSSLEQYMNLASESRQIDLAANELRRALDSLGKITGKVSTEEILSVIFRDFCIGK